MLDVTRALSGLICALALLVPMSASAADNDKLFIGASTGLGGEFEGDFDTDVPFGILDFDIDDDMETSWGGFLHYESPVHRHFAIGGRLGFLGFNTEGRADEDWSRNWAINADIAPKLRFPISGVPIELYATTPVGLSVLFASSDWEDEDVEFDPGVSWNLSILGGASFLITDEIGVFAEGGWMLQNVNWNGETSDGAVNIDLEGEFSQVALNFGLVLPF